MFEIGEDVEFALTPEAKSNRVSGSCGIVSDKFYDLALQDDVYTVRFPDGSTIICVASALAA